MSKPWLNLNSPRIWIKLGLTEGVGLSQRTADWECLFQSGTIWYDPLLGESEPVRT